MVPPYSHRISRARRYSGYNRPTLVFAYETITLCGGPSHVLPLTSAVPYVVRTPKVFLPSVWPLPRSLATTYGISVDFFSSPYLDVSVRAVPRIWLFYSPYDGRAYPAGFPHSEIHGSMPAFGYPWHIADRCVLLRLLVPRHSPCTLCSLTCVLRFFSRRKCRFTQSFGSSFTSFCFTLIVLCSVFKVRCVSRISPRRYRGLVGSMFESLSAFRLMCFSHFAPPLSRLGGLKWTRTTDLTLIRRAL